MTFEVDSRDALTWKLLEIEFDRLQSAVDKFDDQRFKVKGWSITVAGALLALGVNAGSAWLIFAGAVTALFFGFMETVYMQIQVRVITRSNQIESLLSSAMKNGCSVVRDKYSFGVRHAFVGDFQWSAIPETLRRRLHITVFHFGLVLAMLSTAALVAWA